MTSRPNRANGRAMPAEKKRRNYNLPPVPKAYAVPPALLKAADLMSPQDYAAIFGVQVRSLYPLFRAGTIPAIRVGQYIKIPKAAVIDKLLAAAK